MLANSISREEIVSPLKQESVDANGFTTVVAGDVEIRVPTWLFINNEYVPAISGRTFETINPCTEEAICSLAEADKEDVDVAVAAARRAFNNGWRDSDPSVRYELMQKLVVLLKREAETLAALESLDNGKPLSFSRAGDVPMLIKCFEYYAGWCDKILGESIPSGPNHVNFTRRQPVGVCGQIIPWNFPLKALAMKIAPAIACGNTVVLKSAEQTPLTAMKFSELVLEAGFPAGVINILSGYGATCGAALASHMDVDKVGFTGSTGVGRKIMSMAAESNLKKVSLELGGKSPLIVFSDADLPSAVAHAFKGVFWNNGQMCTACSRIYVEEKVHDEFVRLFKETADNWKVGNPFEEGVMQGPQVSERQFNHVMSYIQAGIDEGAHLICGGKRAFDVGYFIQPTVFIGVRDDMRIAREEIFGPVSSILSFSEHDLPDIIRRANDTKYGLAAGLFTKDISRAHRVANQLDAGTVWINQYNKQESSTPFGGFKESGLGRENGMPSIDLYTEIKTVKILL
jgi:aldehyde dehydrogenase (NAD+)